MEKYDYYAAVKSDILDYIKENNIKKSDYSDETDMLEDLSDKLFVEDSVTGNASGSYTFNTFSAEEHLCHNFDLLAEALEYFGSEPGYLKEHGAEAADVTIRCYVLQNILGEVIEELEGDFAE